MDHTERKGDAHVAVYALDAGEVAKVLESGKPLDGERLMKMEPVERYSLATNAKLGPATDPAAIDMPASVGDRIFPGHIFAPRYICICIGYQWCLEYNNQGQLVYVLKCRFICFPTFPLAVVAD